LYTISRFNKLGTILQKNAYQTVLLSIIVFAISGFKSQELFSNKLSLLFLLFLFLFTFSYRILFFIGLKIYRSRGRNCKNVVFVDENDNTHSLIDLLLRRKDYGFIPRGSFLVGIEDDDEKRLYNFDLKKLKRFILEKRIQIIYLSLKGSLPPEAHKELTYLAQNMHVEIRFIPGTVYDSFNSLSIQYYDTFPVLSFKQFPLDKFWNQFFKRIFDIVFSLFVLVFICIWLFPIMAIVILIDSGSPVLYCQKRIGFKGKSFKCYKFRTMKPSKDNDIKATVKGDDRITKVGSLLRKTSLDELPQFFNVLLGNMSVVGPRPHMVVQDEYYNDIVMRYSVRHYVKPGITGLAQVKGLRGEINSEEDMQKRVIADVYYVKNWSFLLDVIIIMKTVFKVLIGDKKAF
jgi:putative colanic acid biosynthesis UDP-glucose lipid carrier transferase